MSNYPYKKISEKIDVISANIIDNIIQAQRETADIICEDVKDLAPKGKTGEYAESIKVGETIVERGVISTEIYTDATVTTKDNKEYNLGFLLETGTNPHAIPNAFGRGNYYGYIGADGRYHKGTLDDDWHPGTIAQPHFSTGLFMNNLVYKQKLNEALKKSFK